MTTIALAVLVGVAFGMTLDRIGATNPGLIIRMLNLTNLHLMKTILMGIGVGSVLLFSSLLTGLVDPGHLSIKASHLGVLIGGLLLGVGFAVAGYCPGTGLAAAATGRIDALFFVVGGLLGAAVFMITYPAIEATGVLDNVLGGKVSMGPISGTKFGALFSSASGEVIGFVLGIALIALAWLLPDRVQKAPQVRPAE